MFNLLKILVVILLLIFQTIAYAAPDEQKIDNLAHAFMKKSNIAGLINIFRHYKTISIYQELLQACCLAMFLRCHLILHQARQRIVRA